MRRAALMKTVTVPAELESPRGSSREVDLPRASIRSDLPRIAAQCESITSCNIIRLPPLQGACIVATRSAGERDLSANENAGALGKT